MLRLIHKPPCSIYELKGFTFNAQSSAKALIALYAAGGTVLCGGTPFDIQ